MNTIQRRLFGAFVRAGGDLSEDAEVERFIRYVESTLVLLPPRIREAVELTWRAPDHVSYDGVAAQLSVREGMPVRATALRQRVSRGARLLEDAVRQRQWQRPPLRAGASRGSPSDVPGAHRQLAAARQPSPWRAAPPQRTRSE